MGALLLVPLTGLPEVRVGDDLAALVVRSATSVGQPLEDGDVLVVSSKVVSKSLGLWALDREVAIELSSRRVVAERRTGTGVTQIVHASAGPVMAAAGVDASNTGGRDEVLLLPTDPDGEAERLRQSLLMRTGLTRLGVVVSDTAGRPWRFGQADFALGAAGVVVIDDLRGGVDADGAPLAVTARALADELAAAADLVKGKADAVPAAIVRGSGLALPLRGDGAAALLRTGRDDWFDYGRAEAVRAALGTEPGSAEAHEAGIASVLPESAQARVARAVAVALQGAPETGMDLGGDVVRVSAPTAYELGVAVTRLQVALWGEGLVARVTTDPPGLEQTLTVTER